jgi:hypothetical protein
MLYARGIRRHARQAGAVTEGGRVKLIKQTDVTVGPDLVDPAPVQALPTGMCWLLNVSSVPRE